MIVLDLDIGDISRKLLNIYTPNKDSPEFFNYIKNIIESNIQTYELLCGNLNLVLDPLLDYDHYKLINNPKSRNLLLETMNSFHLKDIFRFFPVGREIHLKQKKIQSVRPD